MVNRALRGRPPVSSQEMLQDAAFDLFVENSYAKTTIEHIAQRAGVSRATFFNYFPSKSDVFWLDLDQTLELFAEKLVASSGNRSLSPLLGLKRVKEVILSVAAQIGAGRVPFALTQHELIGSVEELQASAISRLSAQATFVTAFLVDHGMPGPKARAASYACMAAVIAGSQEWASQGTTRAPLDVCLTAAIAPVIAGFSSSER